MKRNATPVEAAATSISGRVSSSRKTNAFIPAFVFGYAVSSREAIVDTAARA